MCGDRRVTYTSKKLNAIAKRMSSQSLDSDREIIFH